MKLKEKLKEFGTKTKNFVVKNWKPLVLGTVTVGGIVYCIISKQKKIKDLSKQFEKIDVQEWKVGDLVGAYNHPTLGFTEVGVNKVPIKELGEFGEEVAKKLPEVTEDTLVAVYTSWGDNTLVER